MTDWSGQDFSDLELGLGCLHLGSVVGPPRSEEGPSNSPSTPGCVGGLSFIWYLRMRHVLSSPSTPGRDFLISDGFSVLRKDQRLLRSEETLVNRPSTPGKDSVF